MTFGFNGGSAFIDVPLSALLYPVVNSDGTSVVDPDGNPICYLAVALAPVGNVAVLGPPFLRSAYAVYDLEHGLIGLGQAVLNVSTASAAVQVVTSSAAIPSAAAPTTTVSLTAPITSLTQFVSPPTPTAKTVSISSSLTLSVKGATNTKAPASKTGTATGSGASATKSSAAASSVRSDNGVLGLGSVLLTMVFLGASSVGFLMAL
jgi:hypothetical protein